MPLAVGQWARYKVTDEKGTPGFVTYKVVGEEGGAFWLELVQETYYSRSVILMLADLGDRRDPSTARVLQMKQKDGDHSVTDMPPGMLDMMSSAWEPLIESIIIDWQGQPQEDANVPAGSFAACYKTRSTIAFAGKRHTSDLWSHPAVPLHGGVRSQSVDDASSMELVEFGLDGATAEIPF